MNQLSSRILLIVLTWISFTASSEAGLRYLRNDPSVPAYCTSVQIENFTGVDQLFYFGITGARAKGFTHEVTLERQDARDLWIRLKSGGGGADLRSDLVPVFETLRGASATMGFDYENEGEVLEALALLQLRESFPAQDYYFTGGIEYSNPANASKIEVLGELDLVVARKADCGVVAIGEAKLGIKQLGHARSQINRFMTWARATLCGSPEGETPICEE